MRGSSTDIAPNTVCSATRLMTERSFISRAGPSGVGQVAEHYAGQGRQEIETMSPERSMGPKVSIHHTILTLGGASMPLTLTGTLNGPSKMNGIVERSEVAIGKWTARKKSIHPSLRPVIRSRAMLPAVEVAR